MNVSEIIDIARDQTYTTEDQVSDSQALKYLNIVYRDVANNIIEANQDYFWQSSTRTFVSNTIEYGLPVDADKIIAVYAKYENDKSYIKCELDSFSTIDEDIETMDKEESPHHPIALIADTSVFVVPTPKKDVSEGLKLLYIEAPGELTLTDTAEDIEIPKQYQDVLWMGMKQYIFASRGMFDAKNNSFQEYANMINKIKSYVKPRTYSSIEAKAINLDYLK